MNGKIALTPQGYNYENKAINPFWMHEGQSDSYNDLEDKPSINGVTLQGDKTTEDLGIHECECEPLTADQLNQLLRFLW